MKNLNQIFIVETKSGSIQSISCRRRWILKDPNTKKIPIGAADGHAECKGRMACGHIDCKGKYACGNPTKSGESGDLSNEQLLDYFKDKKHLIPNKNASVFDLLKEKSKIHSAIV